LLKEPGRRAGLFIFLRRSHGPPCGVDETSIVSRMRFGHQPARATISSLVLLDGNSPAEYEDDACETVVNAQLIVSILT
jgi:hypothetical protein